MQRKKGKYGASDMARELEELVRQLPHLVFWCDNDTKRKEADEILVRVERMAPRLRRSMRAVAAASTRAYNRQVERRAKELAEEAAEIRRRRRA